MRETELETECVCVCAYLSHGCLQTTAMTKPELKPIRGKMAAMAMSQVSMCQDPRYRTALATPTTRIIPPPTTEPTYHTAQHRGATLIGHNNVSIIVHCA